MAVKPLRQIFFWPTVLNALSLWGLIFALLDDGLVEKLSLIVLAIPIVLIFYVYFFKP